MNRYLVDEALHMMEVHDLHNSCPECGLDAITDSEYLPFVHEKGLDDWMSVNRLMGYSGCPHCLGSHYWR